MKYVTAGKGEKVVRQDYEKVIQFTVDDFLQPGHLLQEVTIPPKTKQRVHFHTQQTEVFYILEGEAEMTFNGEMVAANRSGYVHLSQSISVMQLQLPTGRDHRFEYAKVFSS